MADHKNNYQYDNLLVKTKISDGQGPKIGKRHIQVILIFLLLVVNYAVRTMMSVVIVAMTDPSTSTNKNIPTYNWTDQGLIMTSFMWGYMMPQIAVGYLATLFGAKWFLTISIAGSSLCQCLIPITAAHIGSKGVVVLRICQGLSQGCMFPSSHAFLGKWLPLQERSRLVSLSYLGSPVGVVLSMVTSGVISSSQYGWPMALYIYGGAGLVVSGLIGWFCVNEPDLHSSITEEEKIYIKNNLSEKGDTGNKGASEVPWLEIFTSLPLWALIIAQAGATWGNLILLFETPLYMNKVMKFDITSNSLLSSLPYVADAGFSMIYGMIADYLITRNILTVKTTRKVMNGWAMLLQAVFLILLAHCDSNDGYKATLYLILIGFAYGAIKSGFNVNHIDLSPNYSGLLMGISNGISAGFSSLGPLIVYILVTNEEDPSQWKVVFYLSAGIAIITYIFNMCFASGSAQAWNEGSNKSREMYQNVPIKA